MYVGMHVCMHAHCGTNDKVCCFLGGSIGRHSVLEVLHVCDNLPKYP